MVDVALLSDPSGCKKTTPATVLLKATAFTVLLLRGFVVVSCLLS